MRHDLYTEIVINISRRGDDNLNKFLKLTYEILKKLKGHEKDIIWISEDKENPFMRNYETLEPIWRCRFITKNIQNRHKNIFKALKLKFSDRNVYLPYEEIGWRLFLTRLSNNIFKIKNFIEDINVQRLNENERKTLKKIKNKYDFAFNSSMIQPIRKFVGSKKIVDLLKQFDINRHLKRLENNPEIDTSEVQKAVDNLLEILNTELFIYQFEKIYKKVNKLWKQDYGWILFKEHDIFDCLKIPDDDEKFHSQIQHLHKILVESLNNKELKSRLKLLGIEEKHLKNKEGNLKKSIDLLELWLSKNFKNNQEFKIINFLKLLHILRGKITHNLKIKKLSKLKEFKEIVKFCEEKQPIKTSHEVGEVFKNILKTSKILLIELKCTNS